MIMTHITLIMHHLQPLINNISSPTFTMTIKTKATGLTRQLMLTLTKRHTYQPILTLVLILDILLTLTIINHLQIIVLIGDAAHPVILTRRVIEIEVEIVGRRLKKVIKNHIRLQIINTIILSRLNVRVVVGVEVKVVVEVEVGVALVLANGIIMLIRRVLTRISHIQGQDQSQGRAQVRIRILNEKKEKVVKVKIVPLK